MSTPLDRRVKHYEEAVVKNIDRPQWHPDKAKAMFETWKDMHVAYAQLESQLKGLLERLNVPTALRGLYYSFGRKIFKMVHKMRATKAEIEAEIDFWSKARGLDRKVLREIVKFISGMEIGTRGR